MCVCVSPAYLEAVRNKQKKYGLCKDPVKQNYCGSGPHYDGMFENGSLLKFSGNAGLLPFMLALILTLDLPVCGKNSYQSLSLALHPIIRSLVICTCIYGCRMAL